MKDVPPQRAPRTAATWCVAAVFAAVGFVPATAVASPSAAPAVGLYTLTAVAVVVLLAVVASAAVHVAYGLRLIGKSRRAQLSRHLRVCFGAVFLLAAVTPYAALNFSAMGLTLFVATAGLIVAAWVWGTSDRRRPDAAATADGH